MTDETTPAPPLPSPSTGARLEYLGFQNVPDHREYRFAVTGADGRAEVHFRIPTSAVDGGRVRLQDGPDVCYQKALKMILAGEAVGPDLVLIDDADLARYREEHTRVPKRRSPAPGAAAASPSPARTFQARTPPRPRPSAPPPPPIVAAPPPPFQEGQRVSHAVFGLGVTTASNAGHTTIAFDGDRPRTFITSMLEVMVLSAPHTWQAGPRGKNRLRDTSALVS